jgi:hypothetical protein
VKQESDSDSQPPPRSGGDCGADCLKMNYALMKTTELKMLWKLVKAGEDRPLSAADLALLLRLRFALQEYEAKVELGPPPRRGDSKMNYAQK